MGYIMKPKRLVDTNNNRLKLQARRVDEGYSVNSKVTDMLQNLQWRGSRCFIIGGGPSIKEQKLNLDRLKGEKVIGINRAYEFYPWIDIIYMMDNEYEKRIKEGKIDHWKKFKEGVTGARDTFNDFKGVKVCLTPMTARKFPPDIFLVRTRLDKMLGLDLHSGIYGGLCSGFGAVQLAMCLGANPIYLLGYDMKVGLQTHWHSGYPKQSRAQLAERLKGYAEELKKYAPQMKAMGFNVVNLNKDSALDCFTFSSLEDLRI